MRGTKRDLVVQIATPLEQYHGELARLGRVLWTILPIGLLVSVVGGYYSASRALAPVDRLAAAAKRISATNLDERLALENSNDELGRLAATLNSMLDRIERAFDANAQFTADAAHELRSPVASIHTEIEVALVTARSAEDLERALRTVLEETKRMARVIDSLLLLAREDACAPIRGEPLGMASLVVSVIEQSMPEARSAGVRLLVESMPDLSVLGDRELLSLAIGNLVSNAVKFTARGGRVLIRGERIGGEAIVEVRDTGIGINEGDLPHLFDRFFRVDRARSRSSGGSGLGLSIVRSIVERHGGSIEVLSTFGVGSTFRLRLPLSGSR
jgi:heavy metal sensor kinase